MRAVVQTGYGKPSEVLEVGELDRPPVGDGQVLVRVRASSVHPDVWHVVMGLPRVLRMMGSGLRRPRDVVPGTDMAGQVESVGSRVTRFGPGDEVFGETLRGMQWRNGGAYAEYVVVDEDALALKPSNVTFEQAATVPTSGLITLQNLPDLGRRPGGQRVLVNGAGGGVGAMAVQLARSSGAHSRPSITPASSTCSEPSAQIGSSTTRPTTSHEVRSATTSCSTWWAITRSRRTDASSRPTAPTC